MPSKENTERPPMAPWKQKLRNATKFTYDLQKMRIQSGNRSGQETADLDDDDKAFLEATSTGLDSVEKEGFKEVKRLLKGIPIWEEWLKHQKGIGPAMGGILISFLDIERATTPSKFWAYSGLAVVDGKADRMKAGVRGHFDPWFKSKMVEVMATSFLRSGSDWRKFYDDRKHRQENKIVDPCMACKGVGKAKGKPQPGEKPNDKKVDGALVVCWNCAGKGKGPWGVSPAHRNQDAKRVMVKAFLRELWVQWRTLEGLEVRPPYAEEYLDRKHTG